LGSVVLLPQARVARTRAARMARKRNDLDMRSPLDW
jgi:hypothetical protein